MNAAGRRRATGRSLCVIPIVWGEHRRERMGERPSSTFYPAPAGGPPPPSAHSVSQTTRLPLVHPPEMHT